MIRVSTRGRVRVIELDRAEKRNALTPEMLDGLIAAFGGLGREGAPGAGGAGEEVGAALVIGAGPVFCAGFDLELCQGDGPGLPTLRRLLELLSGAIGAMRGCGVPVVVGAHGAAVAGGCALLAGADVVVADAGAKLGYPVARLGISPAVSGPTLRLAAGDGPARAWMLEGGLYSGREAWRAGLVHVLEASAAGVGERALGIAQGLAAKPGGAAMATKAWCLDVSARGGGADGLAASVGLLGGDEAAELLGRFWAREGG